MREAHDNMPAPRWGLGKITKRDILIAVPLVIGFGLAYWAWTENGDSLLWEVFFLALLIPLGLLMLVDGILLGLIFKGFWARWLEFFLLLALWFAQTTVLLAWTARITASDAFLTVPEKYLIGPWNPYGLVIDSQFQETFMTAFWYGAAGIVAIIVITSLVRVGLVLARRRKRQPGTGWRILTVVVTLFILAMMFGSVREFHRMGASLGDSTSPDGELQVRVVPIDTFSDTNGVFVFRQAGSLWWYPMDTVGDQLTSPPGEVSFVWDSGTQVRLLVNSKPCGTYDLTTGINIATFGGKGIPRATRPATNPTPATHPGINRDEGG